MSALKSDGLVWGMREMKRLEMARSLLSVKELEISGGYADTPGQGRVGRALLELFLCKEGAL